MEKLRTAWLRRPTPTSAAGGAASAAAAAGGAPPPRNGVCEHTACAHRHYCLVKELDKVRQVYRNGRGVDGVKIGVSH